MEGNDDITGENTSDDEWEVHLLRPELIQTAVREIQRGTTRSRQIRIKLLYNANLYFTQLAESVTKNPDLHSHLLTVLTDLQNLIVETANLSVSLSDPPSRIGEVYDTLYNMGAYIENVIIAVYTRCVRSGQLFGDLMKDFLNSLIKISCNNPTSWLYSVLISPIVIHMMNAFSQPDHEDFLTSWCYEIGELMFQVGKAIFNCGDFSCQHYLVTFFSCWTRWANPARVLPVINSVFRNVSGNVRKELLHFTDNPEASVRIFLNAFNISPRGPKSIIPIPYLYLFVCDTEIRPPEHQVHTTKDLWADFSIVSGRLHAFYSIPGTASLVSLSIRRDQIDSVCLHWVVNDGQSQVADTQEEYDTQTQSTFMKDEKVLFFHIVLSVDFESVTSDIPCLNGKHYRSIYFVFRNGDLVEKVMRDMGYNIHECGTKNCERPRALRRLLSSVHKLSYTETWCPESQVFGLDKSLDRTNGSIDSHKSGCQSFSQSLLNITNKENVKLNQTLVSDYDVNTSRISETSSAYYVSLPHSVNSHDEDEDEENEDILINDELNETTVTNFEDSLPPIVRELIQTVSNDCDVNTSCKSETSSAYYVSLSHSVNSHEDEDEENEDISVNDALNASTVTNFEDPLPPTVREKYANACKHAPFHQKPGNEKNCDDCIQEYQNSKSEMSLPGKLCTPQKIKSSMKNLVLTPSRRLREIIQTPELEASPRTPQKITPAMKNLILTPSRRLRQIVQTPVLEASPLDKPCTPQKIKSAMKNLVLTPSRRLRQIIQTPDLEASPLENQCTPQKIKSSTTNLVLTPPRRLRQIIQTPDWETYSPETQCVPQKNNLTSTPRTNVVDFIFDDNLSSGSLSPVFGYSRTLVDVATPHSESPSTKNSSMSSLNMSRGYKRKNDSGRLPCYFNAFREHTSKLLEKMKNEDYDPYDLWSSSEMDEFRDKLFPKKMKTYAVRKNAKRKGKGKIVKMPKRNLQYVLGQKTACIDDINTEELAFIDNRPSKKYASFFRKRD